MSASDTATINITAVNDAPVIDLLTTAGVQTTAITAAFTESGGAVTVAPQLTLADVDSTTAAGATVTLTNAQTGDVLSLQGQAGTSGTLAGGIGFSISGSTVTFSNVSLLANYQAALQLVQFNNTSVSPITTDRSFAFQIDDGGVVNNLANATATVTIGTVNHAPTTADTSASGAEDGGAIAIVLSGNDIDGTVASFTITSLPTNGTLSTDAAGLNPVALNQLITASGNAATLYFTPAANFNGAPSFQYAAIDNNGAQDATPATATINITAVDDAPVNVVPGAQTVAEDSNLSITGLSVSDVDAASASITTTLSVLHGTLTVLSAGGAAVAGSGTATVTLTGTVSQINTTLAAANNVVYRGVQDFNGSDTLTVVTSDGGNTGTGGTLTDSDTVAITVTAANDAPVNVVPGAQTVAEDSNLSITGLSVSDVDAASASITTTLSVLHGTLTVLSAGGAAVAGSGTATVTLTGTVSQINTTLAAANNVVYRGVQDFNGSDTLTVVTSDGGNTGTGGTLTDSDTVAITVTAANDAPVNVVPGAQTVAEDSNLSITGLSVSDVDAASASITTTLSVLHGTLTVLSAGGAAVAGSGTATVTLTGTVSQINTTLAAANNVVYRGVQDFNGSDTLTVVTSDGGNTGTGGTLTDSDTVAITVTAANDPPTIAGDLTIELNDSVVVPLTTNDLHAVDPDNTPSQLTFTVTGSTNGNIALANNPGVTIASFTEVQLEAGDVVFVRVGTSPTATFSVSLSDGAPGSPVATATVNGTVATVTVLTPSGFDFGTNNPFKEMGAGQVQPGDLNGLNTTTHFTIVNTNASVNRDFLFDGTGFTYGAVDGQTARYGGGTITAIHELTHGTHAAIANFTGLSVSAVDWFNAVVAFAAGNTSLYDALTASWAFNFIGSTGPDVFRSGDQADVFIFGGGDDTYDGESQRDRVDFSTVTGPINVQLATGLVTGTNGGTAFTNVLHSIESITGTNATDTYNAFGFSASSVNAGSAVTFDVDGTINNFEGRGGDDLIIGNGDTRIVYTSASVNAATLPAPYGSPNIINGVRVIFSSVGAGTASGDTASVGIDTFERRRPCSGLGVQRLVHGHQQSRRNHGVFRGPRRQRLH